MSAQSDESMLNSLVQLPSWQASGRIIADPQFFPELELA